MAALLKLLGRSLISLCILGGLLFVFGKTIQPVQAARCGFRCALQYTESGPTQCSSDASCNESCRDHCAAQGWTSTDEAVCATRTGETARRCAGCLCITNTTVSCEPGSAGDNSCLASCAETCTTSNLRTRLTAPIVGVHCQRSAPGPRCLASSLDRCRSCINSCMGQGTAGGSTPVPADCYRSCTSPTDLGDGACHDVPIERAIEGRGSAPTGAVSGSGSRRSHVQSGVSPSTSEAAGLPPGECARRAVRVGGDQAIGRLEQLEIVFEAVSSTMLCRRVCSEQDGAGCITGGCPGGTDVQCCIPSMGIPPAQQCGGRGAARPGSEGAAGGTTDSSGSTGDTGSPGTQGGVTEGGAARPSDSSSGGASDRGSSGSPGSSEEDSRVGASSVSADSGGLTRLILPSCIHDGGCQFSDLVQVGLNLVRFLFGLAGVLLLVIFVYAGFEYLIAGDTAHVKSAEDRIKKALIGLFFMFFGYTLVNFLVGLFINA